MSDTFGALAPQADNPAQQVPDFFSRIPRWFLPNLVSLARGEAPPALEALPEQGKVPGVGDPRVPAGLAEGTNAIANLAPLIAPGGAAVRGAQAVERLAPMLAREAAGSGYRFPAAAAPALAAGLATSEAEAAPRLTLEQRREVEMARQRQQLELDAAKQKRQEDAAAAAELAKQQAEQARQDRLDAAAVERQRVEDEARIAVERQRASDTAARENEAALANRPFRDRFPALATAMSNSGMVLAALLPYGTRAWQAGKSSKFLTAWDDAAHKAEQALLKGDMGEARLFVNKLDGFRKQSVALEKVGTTKSTAGPGTFAVAATLPVETTMLPEQIDLASGSQEAKSRALDTFLDPVRLPAAALTGLTAAGLGAKLPIPIANRVAPEAASSGALKTFREMVRQQAAQKAAATKAAAIKGKRSGE